MLCASVGSKCQMWAIYFLDEIQYVVQQLWYWRENAVVFFAQQIALLFARLAWSQQLLEI